MKIEFFTDDECIHNVRFPGDAYASNEVILGIFYHYISEYEAKFLFNDIKKVALGELSESEQKDYDFDDFISGELNADYVVLKPDGPITSKVYKLKTTDLKQAIEKWLRFRKREAPSVVETIELDAEVID